MFQGWKSVIKNSVNLYLSEILKLCFQDIKYIKTFSDTNSQLRSSYLNFNPKQEATLVFEIEKYFSKFLNVYTNGC